MNIWCPTKITICNIYIPPDYNLSKTELTNILNQLPRPFVITGDFNAHNKIWGSQTTFGKGKILEEVLVTSNITILNTGQHTHFATATGTLSSIDLSFCDPKIAPLITWNVLDSLYDSDHFPILITLDNKNCEIPFTASFWKLKHANWEGFRNKIEDEMSSFQISDDIDISLDTFTKIILHAAEQYIGTSSTNSNSKSLPWWNNECQVAVKNCKKALNKYRKHKTEENLVAFKHMKAIARKTLKASKRNSWRNYVSTLTKDTPPAQVWQKIKAMKGHKSVPYIPAIINSNHRLTTSNTEIATIIANTIADKSADQNFNLDFIEHKIHQERTPTYDFNYDESPLNLPISKDELTYHISNSRQSAPGPDNIPFVFIQNLPQMAVNKLLELFNRIWTDQTFPKIWRHAIIIPIHKPNKPKTNPESYRPISLTCNLCKLFEKIVNKRLLWYLERNHLINNYQMGFRTHFSTSDNLILLQNDILDAFANKQELIAVFLDIRNAFDSAWRPGILQKLQKWGIKGNILAYIANFLTTRSFKVRVNGTFSEQFTLDNGVPQGSVLSSTLFIVAINDIFSNIKMPVQSTLYADDVVIYCRGKKQDTLCQILQTAIHQLEEWSKLSGFGFSPDKTKVLRFTRRHNSPSPTNIKMNNKNLQVVSQHKYLGVIFDEKLTWKPHIEQLKADCMKRLNILKSLSTHGWGAHEDIMLRVYRALIRPKLDYGCIAYYTAKNNNVSLLNTIQNTALRISLGAFRSSPAESLHRESGELPLTLRRKLLMSKYAARISSRPDHPVYQLLNKRNNNDHLYRGNNNFPRPLPLAIELISPEINLTLTKPIRYPATAPWCLQLPVFDLSLTAYKKEEYPNNYLRSVFYQSIAGQQPDLVIYTDASKDTRGVGSAVILYDQTHKYHLSDHCSIFTAELYAIHQAFNLAAETEYNKITICTDSLSSIRAIDSLYNFNPLVTEIHETNHHLTNMGKKVTLMWIPSHVGIAGNEKADKAAREAIDETERVSIHLYYDIDRTFYNIIHQRWQEHWTSKPSKTREIEPTTKFTSLPLLPRRSQIVIRRLRLGHTRMTHKYLMLAEDAPLCPSCNTTISVRHVLMECSQYAAQRRLFHINNVTLADTLAIQTENLPRLIGFLKATNLYCQL